MRAAWHAICLTTGMRSGAVIIFACAVTACGMNPPPKQTEFPTLDPGETYHTRIANLRTTLARADITLRVAGLDAAFASADCDALQPRRAFGGCARCELAGEATPVDGAVLEAAAGAFSRYPTAVLVASGIDHVAVCRELVYAKRGEVEHPAGLADVRGRGLLISVRYFLDTMYRTHGTFTVDDIAHHEVFHLLEHEHMRDEMLDDPEWRLHNPLGFEYFEGANASRRRDGFVSSYAMTNAVEDKASVYGHLMAHPHELCELARTDETIRIKTRIIWRRVARAVGTDAFMREAAPCVDWIDG